ncbi:dipeptide ABC transporter ATP-binding protein [Rhodococcus zopfii]|uniref:dipeptide ABC transporter ATP-binding protein n=1 Tax=Rhodococcus zopfii TaxID=43772 RepID=UPI0011115B22|nr:ABC transporter ATP-binding protein [Rhodococcus zopfii]
MSVLAVENLSVGFSGVDGDSVAVREVSFAVEPGRTLGIVGESGSGKSVSLLAATGLLGPGAVVRGRALHHGTDLIAAPPRQLRAIRGKDIGFVFQDPLSNLHPLMPIGRQIAEAITAHGRVPRAALRARVLELLDEVGIARAAERIDDYPVHFSGGMRQRVMIAIAVANNPGLVIADEPTTALDTTVQASILTLLQRLQNDHGTAMIVVSHDLAVVSDVAHDVVVMRNGEVVETGSAREIYTAPAHPYTRTLLDARPTIGSRPAHHRATEVERPALLRVSDLSKSFEGRRRHSRNQVLTGVNFTIGQGEIVGLVGESGSGKSTIGRIVAGLDRPDSGSVSFRESQYGLAGRGAPRLAQDLRRSIQMVFQDPYGSLNPRRRIGDILSSPYELDGTLSRERIHELVEHLVVRVGLPVEFLQRFPGQLSGGQRQRVAIARAVALEPALVVADEPVSALDVTTQRQIIELLHSLRTESGTSILFVSHDLGAVSALCDRVVVLQQGRIVEEGPVGDVFADPRHDYTRALLDAVPGRGRLDAVHV